MAYPEYYQSFEIKRGWENDIKKEENKIQEFIKDEGGPIMLANHILALLNVKLYVQQYTQNFDKSFLDELKYINKEIKEIKLDHLKNSNYTNKIIKRIENLIPKLQAIYDKSKAPKDFSLKSLYETLIIDLNIYKKDDIKKLIQWSQSILLFDMNDPTVIPFITAFIEINDKNQTFDQKIKALGDNIHVSDYKTKSNLYDEIMDYNFECFVPKKKFIPTPENQLFFSQYLDRALGYLRSNKKRDDFLKCAGFMVKIVNTTEREDRAELIKEFDLYLKNHGFPLNISISVQEEKGQKHLKEAIIGQKNLSIHGLYSAIHKESLFNRQLMCTYALPATPGKIIVEDLYQKIRQTKPSELLKNAPLKEYCEDFNFLVPGRNFDGSMDMINLFRHLQAMSRQWKVDFPVDKTLFLDTNFENRIKSKLRILLSHRDTYKKLCHELDQLNIQKQALEKRVKKYDATINAEIDALSKKESLLRTQVFTLEMEIRPLLKTIETVISTGQYVSFIQQHFKKKKPIVRNKYLNQCLQMVKYFWGSKNLEGDFKEAIKEKNLIKLNDRLESMIKDYGLQSAFIRQSLHFGLFSSAIMSEIEHLVECAYVVLEPIQEGRIQAESSLNSYLFYDKDARLLTQSERKILAKESKKAGRKASSLMTRFAERRAAVRTIKISDLLANEIDLAAFSKIKKASDMPKRIEEINKKTLDYAAKSKNLAYYLKLFGKDSELISQDDLPIYRKVYEIIVSISVLISNGQIRSASAFRDELLRGQNKTDCFPEMISTILHRVRNEISEETLNPVVLFPDRPLTRDEEIGVILAARFIFDDMGKGLNGAILDLFNLNQSAHKNADQKKQSKKLMGIKKNMVQNNYAPENVPIPGARHQSLVEALNYNPDSSFNQFLVYSRSIGSFEKDKKFHIDYENFIKILMTLTFIQNKIENYKKSEDKNLARSQLDRLTRGLKEKLEHIDKADMAEIGPVLSEIASDINQLKITISPSEKNKIKKIKRNRGVDYFIIKNFFDYDQKFINQGALFPLWMTTRNQGNFMGPLEDNLEKIKKDRQKIMVHIQQRQSGKEESGIGWIIRKVKDCRDEICFGKGKKHWSRIIKTLKKEKDWFQFSQDDLAENYAFMTYALEIGKNLTLKKLNQGEYEKAIKKATDLLSDVLLHPSQSMHQIQVEHGKEDPGPIALTQSILESLKNWNLSKEIPEENFEKHVKITMEKIKEFIKVYTLLPLELSTDDPRKNIISDLTSGFSIKVWGKKALDQEVPSDDLHTCIMQIPHHFFVDARKKDDLIRLGDPFWMALLLLHNPRDHIGKTQKAQLELAHKMYAIGTEITQNSLRKDITRQQLAGFVLTGYLLGELNERDIFSFVSHLPSENEALAEKFSHKIKKTVMPLMQKEKSMIFHMIQSIKTEGFNEKKDYEDEINQKRLAFLASIVLVVTDTESEYNHFSLYDLLPKIGDKLNNSTPKNMRENIESCIRELLSTIINIDSEKIGKITALTKSLSKSSQIAQSAILEAIIKKDIAFLMNIGHMRGLLKIEEESRQEKNENKLAHNPGTLDEALTMFCQNNPSPSVDILWEIMRKILFFSYKIQTKPKDISEKNAYEHHNKFLKNSVEKVKKFIEDKKNGHNLRSKLSSILNEINAKWTGAPLPKIERNRITPSLRKLMAHMFELRGIHDTMPISDHIALSCIDGQAHREYKKKPYYIRMGRKIKTLFSGTKDGKFDDLLDMESNPEQYSEGTKRMVNEKIIDWTCLSFIKKTMADIYVIHHKLLETGPDASFDMAKIQKSIDNFINLKEFKFTKENFKNYYLCIAYAHHTKRINGRDMNGLYQKFKEGKIIEGSFFKKLKDILLKNKTIEKKDSVGIGRAYKKILVQFKKSLKDIDEKINLEEKNFLDKKKGNTRLNSLNIRNLAENLNKEEYIKTVEPITQCFLEKESFLLRYVKKLGHGLTGRENITLKIIPILNNVLTENRPITGLDMDIIGHILNPMVLKNSAVAKKEKLYLSAIEKEIFSQNFVEHALQYVQDESNGEKNSKKIYKIMADRFISAYIKDTDIGVKKLFTKISNQDQNYRVISKLCNATSAISSLKAMYEDDCEKRAILLLCEEKIQLDWFKIRSTLSNDGDPLRAIDNLDKVTMILGRNFKKDILPGALSSRWGSDPFSTLYIMQQKLTDSTPLSYVIGFIDPVICPEPYNELTARLKPSNSSDAEKIIPLIQSLQNDIHNARQFHFFDKVKLYTIPTIFSLSLLCEENTAEDHIENKKINFLEKQRKILLGEENIESLLDWSEVILKKISAPLDMKIDDNETLKKRCEELENRLEKIGTPRTRIMDILFEETRLDRIALQRTFDKIKKQTLNEIEESENGMPMGIIDEFKALTHEEKNIIGRLIYGFSRHAYVTNQDFMGITSFIVHQIISHPAALSKIAHMIVETCNWILPPEEIYIPNDTMTAYMLHFLQPMGAYFYKLIQNPHLYVSIDKSTEVQVYDAYKEAMKALNDKLAMDKDKSDVQKEDMRIALLNQFLSSIKEVNDCVNKEKEQSKLWSRYMALFTLPFLDETGRMQNMYAISKEAHGEKNEALKQYILELRKKDEEKNEDEDILLLLSFFFKSCEKEDPVQFISDLYGDMVGFDHLKKHIKTNPSEDMDLLITNEQAFGKEIKAHQSQYESEKYALKEDHIDSVLCQFMSHIFHNQDEVSVKIRDAAFNSHNAEELMGLHDIWEKYALDKRDIPPHNLSHENVWMILTACQLSHWLHDHGMNDLAIRTKHMLLPIADCLINKQPIRYPDLSAFIHTMGLCLDVNKTMDGPDVRSYLSAYKALLCLPEPAK